jgi:hypothetical protein
MISHPQSGTTSIKIITSAMSDQNDSTKVWVPQTAHWELPAPDGPFMPMEGSTFAKLRAPKSNFNAGKKGRRESKIDIDDLIVSYSSDALGLFVLF